MARTVRIQHEDQLYFVRNITAQQTYLFVPDAAFNRLARGALARAATRHHAQVYAVCFVLNRFEMMVRCPRLNLPEFMKSFQAELARAVNRLHGRQGAVFERRYFKADALGEDGILERFLAITNAPIIHGLVPTINAWPGLNAWTHITARSALAGTWLNHKELRRLTRKTQNKHKTFTLPADAGVEHHALKLTRLPVFKDLDEPAYLRKLEDLRADHAAGLRGTRRDDKRSYVGLKKLKGLKWHHRPKRHTRPERPLCFGPAAMCHEHTDKINAINRAYAAAMRDYVENIVVPQFPPYTCRPGLLVCERPAEAEVEA